MNSIDISIFRYFNGWARVSPLTDDILIFLTDNIGYLLLAFIIFGLFFLKRPTFQKFFISLMSLLSSAVISRFIITELIRTAWWRLRPFEVLKGVQQLLVHTGGGSFPSGHAAFYSAIAGTLFFIDKRLGVVALGVSVLMGVARVSSGIHWPSDILGGLVVGMFIGLFFGYVGDRFQKKLSPR